MTTLHIVISGRVQGVCFRASAQAEATRRGLTGWVRNGSDGTVELLACGEAAQVAEFRDWCSRGPASARVDRVDAAPWPLPEHCGGFHIR